MMKADQISPARDCALCPRLLDFRCANRAAFPDKFNAPVPSFGALDASFLLVGLAPGLRGANFTGRPFTGDYAGDMLYPTLLHFGFAKGVYGARVDDGLELVKCRITNAVRCVPPENKPEGDEIKNCQPFLEEELASMPNLEVILALGKIAHDAVIRATGHKLSSFKFAHGALHDLKNGVMLADSYHCSRYNSNTGRLNQAMFDDVFRKIQALIALS